MYSSFGFLKDEFSGVAVEHHAVDQELDRGLRVVVVHSDHCQFMPLIRTVLDQDSLTVIYAMQFKHLEH